jgi:hypothetical protein
VLVPGADVKQLLAVGGIADDAAALLKTPEILPSPPERLQRVVFEGPDSGHDEPVVVEADAIVIDIGP